MEHEFKKLVDHEVLPRIHRLSSPGPIGPSQSGILKKCLVQVSSEIRILSGPGQIRS